LVLFQHHVRNYFPICVLVIRKAGKMKKSTERGSLYSLVFRVWIFTGKRVGKRAAIYALCLEQIFLTTKEKKGY
jgi:hypothetical protein